MVGPKHMQTINQLYLGHDYVTDVLTFDLTDTAEIVICPSMATKNAKTYGNSVNREILLYVIHGLLHLSGYDDHTPKDIQRMRLTEERLLKASI